MEDRASIVIVKNVEGVRSTDPLRYTTDLERRADIVLIEGPDGQFRCLKHPDSVNTKVAVIDGIGQGVPVRVLATAMRGSSDTIVPQH